MFSLIRESLTGFGYSQWSLADFCHPGGMTKYNLNYWRAPQTLLIGFGAGAHTHYFGGHSWSNDYSVDAYIKSINEKRFAGVLGQSVPTEELMRKYLVLGMHCLSLETAPFKRLFGQELTEVFSDELKSLAESEWIKIENESIEVTKLGEFYLQNIAQKFYSDECRTKVQPWSMGLRAMRNIDHVPMPSKTQS
jgi:oxygen-independent coproporphyrinogen-3 oxidase